MGRLLTSGEIRLDGGRILETSEGKAVSSLWRTKWREPCTEGWPEHQVLHNLRHSCRRGWGPGRKFRLRSSVPGTGPRFGAETACKGQAVTTQGGLGRSLGPPESQGTVVGRCIRRGAGPPQEFLSLWVLPGCKTLPAGVPAAVWVAAAILGSRGQHWRPFQTHRQMPGPTTVDQEGHRWLQPLAKIPVCPGTQPHWLRRVQTAPCTWNSTSSSQDLPTLSKEGADSSHN